jgi:hypothetical protein
MKKSRCVVIKSTLTLKQLQVELFNAGVALRELLEADFPDVDDVLAAVERIENLLTDHPVSIRDQWVTAHVVIGGKKKSISNSLVREVSILLLLCCFLFSCIINLVFLVRRRCKGSSTVPTRLSTISMRIARRGWISGTLVSTSLLPKTYLGTRLCMTAATTKIVSPNGVNSSRDLIPTTKKSGRAITKVKPTFVMRSKLIQRSCARRL